MRVSPPPRLCSLLIACKNSTSWIVLTTSRIYFLNQCISNKKLHSYGRASQDQIQCSQPSWLLWVMVRAVEALAITHSVAAFTEAELVTKNQI